MKPTGTYDPDANWIGDGHHERRSRRTDTCPLRDPGVLA